jgi:hypothetical protein
LSVPATYVIDRTGVVRSRIIGRNEPELDAAVDRLLTKADK